MTTRETCRYRAAHLPRPAVARVNFHTGGPGLREGPTLPVCGTCSREVLRWMAAGTVNAAGQYPTAHVIIR